MSRDRAIAFADAIAKGAPKAVQIADRRHLLNNLLETLMLSLERHRHTMSEVAMQMICKSHATSIAKEQCAASTVDAERTLLFEIIRKRDVAAWPAWLDAAERSP